MFSLTVDAYDPKSKRVVC